MYCPLLRFCFFLPVNKHKQTQKGSNQESMQSGKKWSNLKMLGSGLCAKFLWAPGSTAKKGLAPFSKKIGLRAPQQKFQGSTEGSRDLPPTSTLGPWLKIASSLMSGVFQFFFLPIMLSSSKLLFFSFPFKNNMLLKTCTNYNCTNYIVEFM